MIKTTFRKLNLNKETIKNLSDRELGQIAGGHIKTRGGCTQKNSACNKCPEIDI
jgi:natural product precursor